MKRSIVALVLAVAILPRAPLVLLPNPTPDAAEYLLIARSLARGDGFTLPIKVRHDVEGPAVHDARAERAPLLPLMLMPFVAAGVCREGPITPAIQLPNALVGVACALLAASCAAALARRRGLESAVCDRVALIAGIAVGLHPPLARASCTLWAEPLGVLLTLSAARLELAAMEKDDARLGFVEGVVAALARLARPELWVVMLVLLLARLFGGGRRALVGFVGGAALVTLGALALGFGAPQSFLLRVSSFQDVMWGWGAAEPPAPSVSDYLRAHGDKVPRLIVRQAVDDFAHAVRYSAPVVVLATIAIGRATRRDADRGARRFAALTAAAFVGPALVWSTHDAFRFPITACAVGAPLAIVEGAVIVKGLGARTHAIVLFFIGAMLAFVLAADGRYALRVVERFRGDEIARAGGAMWGGPVHDEIGRTLKERLSAREAFTTAKPWGLALSSGRSAVLLPNRLPDQRVRDFVATHSEVKAIIVRTDIDPSDEVAGNEEPSQYVNPDRGPIVWLK